MFNTLDSTPIKFKQKIKDIKKKNKLLNSLNNTNVEISNHDNHLTTTGNEHDSLSIDDGQV